jgi:hypothetical protein
MLEIKPNHSSSHFREARQAARRRILRRFITYKDLEKAQGQLCCARKRSFRPRMRVMPPVHITDSAWV